MKQTPIIPPDVFAEIIKAIVANAERDRRAARAGAGSK